MAWLHDGEKFSKTSLFVLTQLTNVADTQRKSCEFRFIRGFYVSISIRNILKGNLQPKLKVASV